jgi:hypothetical protein
MAAGVAEARQRLVAAAEEVAAVEVAAVVVVTGDRCGLH